MKKIILIAFLIPASLFAQTKGDNTIIIKKISFADVVNGLLDNGYTIQKLDSNYKTVTTDFINCPMDNGKPSTFNISIYVRVKDSTAFISSKWFSNIGLSRGLFQSSREPGPMDIYPIVYTWGANKHGFMHMNKFAQSLKQPVLYAKQ